MTTLAASSRPVARAAARDRLLTRSLLVLLVLALAHAAWLTRDTLQLRFQRDVARVVFNDNSEALEQAQREAGRDVDSLRAVLGTMTTGPDTANRRYVVVSIADRRIWMKEGDSVIFTTGIAVGSGKHLVVNGGAKTLKFDTPRGWFTVQRLDSAPAWVPPDWHYQEQANKRKLGLVQLVRGVPLKLRDGSEIVVQGNEVVRRGADGAIRPLTASDGREIVADGRIVIPPYGTTQRKYGEVLGDFRLYLGDGYGIHGTNNPASIGTAVSHGCIRLRNEDIGVLYHETTLGTPVFIY